MEPKAFLPGDIFFIVHNDSWISRTFAWFMGSRWSHTGLVAEQGRLRTWTVETSDFNVTSSTLEQYLNNPNVEIEVWRLPDAERRGVAMAYAALRLDDMLYGHLQLLSFAVRLLFRRVGISVPHFIKTGWVCNQVVTYAMAEAGYRVFSPEELKSLDTEEVYQRVRAHGHLIHAQ